MRALGGFLVSDMSHWYVCARLLQLYNSSTEQCSSLACCRQLIDVFVVLEHDTFWFNGKAEWEAELWIKGCWCADCPGEIRGGGGGIREAVHRKRSLTSWSQMEREALKPEEMWSEVAFEEVRKHVGLGHEGALMQCQDCRQTTAETTRQMIKMSPIHPLTLFVLSGKDKHDLRRDPDACFIQIPTGHSSDHSPNTDVLQSNKGFLRILQLSSEGKKRKDINILVRWDRTEPMKGGSC